MVQYPMHRISVTAGFGLYTIGGVTSMHYAIDIARQTATPNVVAAHSGRVIYSYFDSAGGNSVAIQGPFNEYCEVITRYGHLENRAVRQGDTVERGRVLGRQGNTGTATTGQHLHFETWLVPYGYTYSYAGRAQYAVDPLSVCHVLSDQVFISDRYTNFHEGIPWPEPPVDFDILSDSYVQLYSGVEIFLVPFNIYAPIVGGYNRSRRYITDFWNTTQYTALYRTVTGGIEWAGIITPYGLLWIPILPGRSELIINGTPEPPEPPGPGPGPGECEEELALLERRYAELEALQRRTAAELEEYRIAIDRIGNIIDGLE